MTANDLVNLVDLNCGYNQLSETVLNELFDSLPVVSLSDEEAHTVHIKENTGTNSCDVARATCKNWEVKK